MVVRLFLAALILLLFPAKVNAAFTLEAVTPTEITSETQELTLYVSATNLSSSTQYLQAAITKDGQSNYLGYTQNNSGNWVKYASSPDLSSLVSFTPTDGNWNGEVKAKIDTSDSGFAGPGTYNIKLIKYITSSGTSSNSLPLVVNISAPSKVPTQAVTEEAKKENKKTESIVFTLPTSAKVGQEFDISFSLSNFDAGNYYIKARIGADSSHMSQGQTWSGDWLGDTDSWSKFPQVSGNGKVKVRISPAATAGDYKIKLSLKKGDDSPIVSEEKSLNFAANPITSTTVPSSQTKPPTIAPKTSTGIVLATSSSVSSVQAMIKEHYRNKDILGTISAKTKNQNNKKKALNLLLSGKITEDFQIGGYTAIGGFILLCTGAGLFLRKKLSQDR